MTNELTIKEKGFIDDYLFSKDSKLLGNATQCALKWFDINNNDENVAGVIGHEYLRKPKIIEYKENKLNNIAEEISEKRIVNELWKLYNRSLDESNLNSAKGTLELLGKWRAMFTDKQITETGTVEDLLRNELKSKDTTDSKPLPGQNKAHTSGVLQPKSIDIMAHKEENNDID